MWRLSKHGGEYLLDAAGGVQALERVLLPPPYLIFVFESSVLTIVIAVTEMQDVISPRGTQAARPDNHWGKVALCYTKCLCFTKHATKKNDNGKL